MIHVVEPHNGREDQYRKWITQSAHWVWIGASNALYHTCSFLLIALKLQALMGRWIHQFLVELETHNTTPSNHLIQQLTGWPLIAASIMLAFRVQLYNLWYQKDDAAVQDYIYALFSSSILYIALNMLSKTSKTIAFSMTAFIITSAIIPIACVFLLKSLVPISSNRFRFLPQHFTEEDFPKYITTKTEKLLNITTGLRFGSSLMLLFWVITRKINDQIVPLSLWHTGASIGYALYSAFIGYHLTTHPKAFHIFSMLSRALTDGAFSYAGLSGIAYQALRAKYACEETQCWPESIETQLTHYFIPCSILLALFSAGNTRFRYAKNHEIQSSFIHSFKNKWAYLVCCKKTPDSEPNQDTPLLPLNA